jgi:hypothetical protein
MHAMAPRSTGDGSMRLTDKLLTATAQNQLFKRASSSMGGSNSSCPSRVLPAANSSELGIDAASTKARQAPITNSTGPMTLDRRFSRA